MCVLAAIAAFFAWPAAASAHLRTGTVAVSYRAAVTSGQSPAFHIGVYASDLALHLTVARGHTVVVYGYLGEPFLRVGTHGDVVEDHSPTAAAAGIVGKSNADARAVTWHDSRVKGLPPHASTARWSIPISVDGHRALIAGVVQRLPAPQPWPWIALLAVFLALVAVAGLRCLLARAAVVLATVAMAATVLTAAGFALDAYASPGTWIAGLDEAAFAAAAAAGLAWAPPIGRAAAAGGAGLLGVAVGLSKGALFLHPIVLSVFPGTFARLLAAVSIAAGLAAAIAAGLWFLDAPALRTARKRRGWDSNPRRA